MISARRLSRKFGKFPAVDSVDFEIPRGEVVGFLGPNGAGKTTTLRMICGYLRPTSGCVLLDGIDVAARPCRAQERIGYLPELAPLYGEMRVQEYLRFRAALFRVRRAARARAIDRALERCRLQEVRRRLIHQLSRGYRQRVGLAAALLHDPPVLILDEPTAGLDPAQVREVRTLIGELAGAHTILLSTHNLAEVEHTCDRILMMARGRVRASGTVDELRGGADQYVVECDRSDAIRRLRDLAGIREVRAAKTGNGWQRFTVTAAGGAGDLRETIGRALAGSGAAVRELRREAASLERLFVRIVDDAETAPGEPPETPETPERAERAP